MVLYILIHNTSSMLQNIYLVFIPVLNRVSEIHPFFGMGELTGFGPGGFGPPACRATMIWSTERTVRAASVASLMAQLLEIMRSRMPSFSASRVPVSSSF